MSYKEFLSTIAIGITLYAFLPYIRSILSGATKPHVFSWIIWGITTCVVFLAQIKSHGGVGAWPIGVSGSITLVIAILAYTKRADISITRLDTIFFIAALTSLPVWYLTADPLWAVVLLTIIDLLGFGPTIRKTYYSPYSESIYFYFLFMIRNVLVLFALESYSLTTILFPALVAVACCMLMAMMLYRRKIDIKNRSPSA